MLQDRSRKRSRDKGEKGEGRRRRRSGSRSRSPSAGRRRRRSLSPPFSGPRGFDRRIMGPGANLCCTSLGQHCLCLKRVHQFSYSCASAGFLNVGHSQKYTPRAHANLLTSLTLQVALAGRRVGLAWVAPGLGRLAGDQGRGGAAVARVAQCPAPLAADPGMGPWAVPHPRALVAAAAVTALAALHVSRRLHARSGGIKIQPQPCTDSEIFHVPACLQDSSCVFTAVTFEERQRMVASRASPPRERLTSPLPEARAAWGISAGFERPSAAHSSGGGSDRGSSPVRLMMRPSSAGGEEGAERPSSRSGARVAAAATPAAAEAGSKAWGAHAGWDAPIESAAPAQAAGGAANVWQAPLHQQNGWGGARASAPSTAGCAPSAGAADAVAAAQPAAAAATQPGQPVPGVDLQQKIWYYLDPQVGNLSH